jgi:hypothetical protein
MPEDLSDLSDLSLDLASLPEVQTTAFKALQAQQPLPIDRYLLFDAAELSSLHEQQGVLLFFLDLAIALGRTLVLPRCRLRRLLADGSPSAQNEFVPWSELFDLATLSALHPAIPLESFVASHGRVDLLAFAAPASCAPTTGAVERAFNGLPALPVMRSECGVHRSATALRSLSHAAIGFVGSTELLGAGRAAQLRPHVRFERAVYAEAASFVRHRFNDRPFAAVHWGHAPQGLAPPHAGAEAVKAEAATGAETVTGSVAAGWPPGALRSAHDVARHSRRLMKRHGVRRCFLATDCDARAELAQLHAKLQPVRYARAGAGGVPGLRQLVASEHVEIVICAMADYFLGTHASRFTAAVLEERTTTFGLDAATAAEMDDDHNSTVAPSSGRTPQPRHLKDEL